MFEVVYKHLDSVEHLVYYDTKKDECDPRCPYYMECQPDFIQLAEALEEELG